ncbi:uncharacterized protein LOC116026978 [Ipomoea triloba]|uniref:uncharacterized protein LOC116026978 n=1 Tax=Ipomoea triloba TaxID=35885 RepID=UPI00125D5C1B|nr:uncharacterized protein LOC116026978 [Ipomoea triloba]
MAPMYVLVEELHKDHTSIAIRLRAVRTYNVWHSRGRDQIKSRECVFHDEAGSYIHMHIPGKSVSPKNDFVEGNVYCIKNFLVVAHWYCYKTCHGEYMMKFYSETLVKDYKGCDFPRNMYRLQPFEILNTLDANILVDVIGRVVEIYSPLEKMINGRPSRLIDFLIEDLKGNQVKCTVWDDHVEKVMPFFKSDLLDPVVVLIQMGRIKLVEKSGEVKICSSYDGTNLLFNQNTLEFVEFRNSYGTTSGGDLSSTKMQITTLSEIFSKRETGDFWVPCKIIGIESDPNDWYYNSCPKQNCNKKLEFNSGMYDCGKCGGRFIKGNLRYKLKIRVVDVNGTTPLLLWDREVLELLCLKTDELKAMQPSVMPKIPKDIRNLKGRDDPTESPIGATPGKQDVAVNETEAVKRSLLDEFSSTQPSKKKKEIVVKMENEKEPTENENSIQDENVIGQKHNRLSSIQTPNQLFGVFQSSLVTPLSVLTEGPSRLSNILIDKNRTLLQDIPVTPNMNQERENENSIQA